MARVNGCTGHHATRIREVHGDLGGCEHHVFMFLRIHSDHDGDDDGITLQLILLGPVLNEIEPVLGPFQSVIRFILPWALLCRPTANFGRETAS